MIAAFLMGAAFICALFIHTSTSFAVGLWISLFLSAIFCMLISKHKLRKKDLAVYLVFFWAGFIIFHSLFLNPVFQIYQSRVLPDQGVMYYEQAFDTFSRVMTLLVCPIYCIALYKTRKTFLEMNLEVFYALLLIFAVYVGFLEIIGYKNIYHLYAYTGGDVKNLEMKLIAKSNYDGQSGTLINRNNSATLINIGFIFSCGYFINRKRIIYILYAAIFGFALYATKSKAGALSLIMAFSFLMFINYKNLRIAFCLAPFALVPFVFMMRGAFESLYSRFPIWEKTVELIYAHPMVGVGSGTFDFYYKKIRTEGYSSGVYAHNDYLNMAAEMGIPALLFFSVTSIILFMRTNRANSPAAAALVAVYIHALVSFPLYIPAISMVCGLLWFLLLYRENLFLRDT